MLVQIVYNDIDIMAANYPTWIRLENIDFYIEKNYRTFKLKLKSYVTYKKNYRKLIA